MRRGMMLALLLLVIATVAGCGGTVESNWTKQAQGEEQTQKFAQTVPVGKFTELDLTAGPGEVLIEGWKENSVSVEVTKKAQGANAAAVTAYLNQVKVRVQDDRDKVSVETVAPENTPDGVKLTGVRYLLRIPALQPGKLVVTGDRANLRVSGIAAALGAKIHRGDVELRNLSGDIDLVVENGTTILSGTDGQLQLQSDSTVQIDNARLRGKGKVQTANARLDVTLASISVGQYEFRTANAPIKLVMPFGAAARFRTATTNGRVYDQLPMTWIDRNETDIDGIYHLEGWLNAGGAEVAVVTTNADITLAYR